MRGRAPIRFVYGNCVFAGGLDDVWAAFSVDVGSYMWLGEQAKQARLSAIVGAIEGVEADVQIVRVSRRWNSPDTRGSSNAKRARAAARGGPRAGAPALHR